MSIVNAIPGTLEAAGARARVVRAPLRVTRLGLALILGAHALVSQAWVLNVTPGPRSIYLQVGVGTSSTTSNATVNSVAVTVPAPSVGNGAAQAMTTDSTQTVSFYDNYTLCTVPQQVYVGASFRQPTTTASVATLQVTTPPSLTSGANTLPFNRVSWTSTAIGNAATDIPAGTFVGGTQTLRSIASNTWVENCLVFSYANSEPRPAGTFTGRATYTLTAP